MNHLEFAEQETRDLRSCSIWLAWINRAERMHSKSLDGDQATDGFSLDGAYAAFLRSESAEQYVASIVGGVKA